MVLALQVEQLLLEVSEAMLPTGVLLEWWLLALRSLIKLLILPAVRAGVLAHALFASAFDPRLSLRFRSLIDALRSAAVPVLISTIASTHVVIVSVGWLIVLRGLTCSWRAKYIINIFKEPLSAGHGSFPVRCFLTTL